MRSILKYALVIAVIGLSAASQAMRPTPIQASSNVGGDDGENTGSGWGSGGC